MDLKRRCFRLPADDLALLIFARTPPELFNGSVTVERLRVLSPQDGETHAAKIATILRGGGRWEDRDCTSRYRCRRCRVWRYRGDPFRECARFNGAGSRNLGGRRLPFLFRLAKRLFLHRRRGQFNNFQFTGKDSTAEFNVCGIVLEVPNQVLGAGDGIGIWMRTLLKDESEGEGWIQIDRGARPELSNFLCPNEEKIAYLAGQPVDDARWVETFAHSLEHSGGYAPEAAKRVASTLLPDIMPYNPGRPAVYPTNGRGLAEDVIDHFLNLFTNGKVIADGVGPNTDLLSEFPYLGPPHKV
jgi:hypothetical protein